jgi:acetyltransferase-like isoleucine patch superfamily enzyme
LVLLVIILLLSSIIKITYTGLNKTTLILFCLGGIYFLQLHSRNRSHVSGAITIGKGCWLAGGVVVSPGVEIGDNVVVGANSVVNRSIRGNVFIAGLPAAILKNI